MLSWLPSSGSTDGVELFSLESLFGLEHSVLAFIKWQYDRDIEGAQDEFKLAAKLASKLNPKNWIHT